MSNKKKWTIIGVAAAVVLAIIVGCTFAIVGAVNRNREQQAAIANKAFGYSASSSTGAGDGGKGGEDDSYTNVPDAVVYKATSVVATIATTYSKLNDAVTKPDATTLESAGMSKQAASSYISLWDTVFAKAHTAGIQPSGETAYTTWAVQNVTGKKPDRTYTITVTASIQPWYTDKNGKDVQFDEEKDTWTVTVDEKSDLVTKVVNPTADQLSFRIPDDLVNETQQQ
ncbi:MAG: hypothetical protein ABF515_01585 [Bifidobacterium sp.]|uniref:Uncharacterized protein n=2 Tax=Bifidobacterium TaxID=1678 RepID=A0A261GC47_9BIFI|nr:hypothetical protein [Bifidobacterium aquikefiri]OZG68813.1 hypothetical protein BAQU_0114 [Bifidobacterium aquikefiri]